MQFWPVLTKHWSLGKCLLFIALLLNLPIGFASAQSHEPLLNTVRIAERFSGQFIAESKPRQVPPVLVKTGNSLPHFESRYPISSISLLAQIKIAPPTDGDTPINLPAAPASETPEQLSPNKSDKSGKSATPTVKTDTIQNANAKNQQNGKTDAPSTSKTKPSTPKSKTLQKTKTAEKTKENSKEQYSKGNGGAKSVDKTKSNLKTSAPRAANKSSESVPLTTALLSKSDARTHKLAVRFGTHVTYSRVAFDWDVVTDYSIRREEDTIFISFSKFAVLNLNEIYKKLPPSIGVFEIGNRLNQLEVAFTVPKSAPIREARIGHIIFIDIIAPATQLAVKPQRRLIDPLGNEPPAPIVPIKRVPPPGALNLVKDSSPAQNKTIESSNSATGNSETIDGSVKVPSANDSGNLDRDAQSPASTGQSQSQTKSQRQQLDQGLTPTNRSQFSAALNPASMRVPITQASTPTQSSLRFQFSDDTSAAAFFSGNYLYVIFDREVIFDHSALGNEIKPSWATPVRTTTAGAVPNLGTDKAKGIKDKSLTLAPIGFPEALALDAGSGVRIQLPAGVKAQLSAPRTFDMQSRQKLAAPGETQTKTVIWSVDFLNNPIVHSDLRLTVQTSQSTAKTNGVRQYSGMVEDQIKIDAEGTRKIIMVPIPEYQTPLAVVPIAMVGRGFVAPRNYSQLIIQPSIQGIVVQRLRDQISFSTSNSGIVIDNLGAYSALTRKSIEIKPFDFAPWLRNSGSYYNEKQRLQQLVAESHASEKINSRYKLALFFFANNHAADSLGVLDIENSEKMNPLGKGNNSLGNNGRNGSSNENDKASRNLEVDTALVTAITALRGAAYLWMNDAGNATKYLNSPLCDSIPSIGWWRGATLAAGENWSEANSQFLKAGDLPADYPIDIRAKLLTAAIEAAFYDGKINRAKELLFGFPATAVNNSTLNRIQYLRALIEFTKKTTNGDRSGFEIMNSLATSSDGWARAHGQWGQISYLLANNKIPLNEAIDRLERLQYAWGGGDLQYQSLVKLSELYFDELKPREGLRRLRQAIIYFPNREGVEALKEKLINRFVALYSDGPSERIPTLAALSVYDENRDLTPQDERGDRMIQSLADRLVKIDLLERAADLLDYQVRKRLTGSERARVGARLAAIQLLDKKPNESFASLDLSEDPDATNTLKQQRQLLRARTLFKAEKPAEALKLLDQITAKEGTSLSAAPTIVTDANRLRAEIYAAQQNWTKAATVLAELVGTAGKEPLDEDRQQLVVNLAASLVMSGDNSSLLKLNRDFIGIFPAGKAQDAFILLSSGQTITGGTDVAALNVRFSELDQFKKAMAAFQAK